MSAVIAETQLLNLNAGQVELKAKAGSNLKRFEMNAYTGVPMRLTGYSLPVVVDLQGLAIPNPKQPILKDHDETQIVGHTEEISKIDGQLYVSGLISGAGQAAKEVQESGKNGFPWQASIGAHAKRMTQVPDGESITVNGQTFKGPLLVARESELREISFVAMGADKNTSAKVEGKKPNMAEVETEVQSEQITASQEIERCKEIQEICASYPKILTEAVEQGWSASKAKDRIELTELYASLPKPSQRQEHSWSGNVEAIEAAACIEAGMAESEAGEYYDEQVMNAAVSKRYRGYSIKAIMKDTIKAAGQDSHGRLTDREFIRAAFTAERNLKASGGLSTVSVSGILSNVANKHMQSSYSAVPTTWRKFCRVSSHSDIKEHSRYRLTGMGGFKPVGKAGELKHVSLSESSYTNQIDTEGAIIALTRQDILNDDMGAFVEIPRILGRMSALKVETAVYELLLSNPNGFFSLANKNYLEGIETVLSIESLTSGEKTFLDQVDANGKPILLTAALLLVPTDLKVTGQQLYADLKVVTGEAQTVTDGNPHQGKFKPEASPFLNAQGIAGSSIHAWYLFSNPADVAAMEVAFLDNQQTPTIEHSDTDFDTLGMKWRAYHDFGVAMANEKAAFKAKGEAAA